MIKRISVLLIGILILKLGYSQSRFTYSLDIAPIYSYLEYKISDFSKQTDIYPSGEVVYDIFNSHYDSTETPRFGFGLMIGVSYKIGDRFVIKTGIGYKNIGEKVSLTPSVANYEYSGQYVPVYSSKPLEASNSYQYLSVPIDFQAILIKGKKMSFGLSLGFDFDINLSSKISSFSNFLHANIKSEFGELPSIAINVHGGLVIDYKLKDNLAIFIQPEFARYLTPNVEYDLGAVDDFYCKIDQFNYYGQLRFGIKINR